MSPDRITAGELRAMGYPILDSIPDCGNIPRSSMTMRAAGGEAVGDKLMVDMEITFTEPFKWIVVTVRLPTPTANARILVSRNKREGQYAGRFNGAGHMRIYHHRTSRRQVGYNLLLRIL